jgi:hypothetical protein
MNSKLKRLLFVLLALGGTYALHRQADAPAPSAADSDRPRIEAKTPDIDTVSYRGVLIATHHNAWQARQQIETRRSIIDSLVAQQGGAVEVGATRYARAPYGTGFEIQQEITITVPRTESWVQLKEDIVRLSLQRP